MRRTVALLIVWVLMLVAPARAGAAWSRLSSAHFVFIGDASARELRGTAQRLERFREAITRVVESSGTTSPGQTVVIVFRNDQSLTPFKPTFQGKPVAVAGFFVGGEDVNYIAVNAEQDSEAYGVVLHEYAHFIIRNAVVETPAWLSEGLAQLYQTFELSADGNGAVLGKPSPATVQLLQAAPRLLPLEEIAEVTLESADYNEGDRRTLFYAQSWALVHYLAFGSPGRAGQLAAYTKDISGGASSADAFRRAFGDAAVLQRELQRYVRAFAFPELRVQFERAVSTSDLAVPESIADGEAAGYLGDMMARLGRTNDARVYLQQTIDAGRDTARALAALGLLELRADNEEASILLLERAVTLSPNLATAHAALGRVLTRRADRGGMDEDALYARARSELERARALEPDNISTLVTLAEVEMGSGADPASAVAMMQRAVAVSPGREDYRLMLAQAFAVSGDYARASAAMAVLATRGSRPEIREGARKALDRVADARRRAAEALADSVAATAAPDPNPEALRASSDTEPRRETLAQGSFVPEFRPVGTGETRVFGAFASVECQPSAIVVELVAADGPVQMAASGFRAVELRSYRQDALGRVSCGAQVPAYPAFATYRTEEQPVLNTRTVRRLVAIELVPEGFTPR